MEILLIQPYVKNMVANILPEYVVEEEGCYPPLGLMYIAAAVRQKLKIKVTILDAHLHKIGTEGIKKEILRQRPDVVGITATTFTLLDALAAAVAVKEAAPSVHLCVGGPHTSIYQDETIRLPAIDSIVVGEGEEAFVELIQALIEKKPLTGIKGLVFKAPDKTIVNNGPRDFIADLDSISFPARDLIDYQRYRSLIAEHYTSTTIISSRGCPYNCLYCYHAFGRKYRVHSISYMLQEIRACLELGIREFWYFDDNFTVDRQRVIAFCTRIIEEKLKIMWHVRTRIDLIDRELLERLRAAGCRRLFIGIESGNEKIIKVLRKDIELAKVREQIKLIKSFGFEIYLDFMIGSPGETAEDIKKTISFAISLDPDYVQFAITTPYPGTDLYLLGLKNGILKEDVWQKFAVQPTKGFFPQVVNEHLTLDELKKLLDLAYRKFYFRPGYIVKKLLTIQSPSDLLFKMRAAAKIFFRNN